MYYIYKNGTEEEKTFNGFNTFEEAESAMKKDVKEFCRKEEIPYEKGGDDFRYVEVFEGMAYVSGPEMYQCWTIRKEIEEPDSVEGLIEIIRTCIDDADDGVSIYAADLKDTEVIRAPLMDAKALLDRLQKVLS